MKKLAITLLILAAIVAGLGFYLQREWRTVGNPAANGGLIDIPHGQGNREIIGLLHEKNVIAANPYAALAYVAYSGSRNKLQAGEYLFDRPMTIPEVIAKLTSGAVYLRKFTVPEGLTIAGVAQKWREQDFGTEEEFLAAAEGAVDLVRNFDEKAKSVEGYLFPETYSFPRRTSPRRAIEAMVARFHETVERLRQTVPAENWPLNLRETIILASLVETEAAQSDE